jgi:hypothetical protein
MARYFFQSDIISGEVAQQLVCLSSEAFPVIGGDNVTCDKDLQPFGEAIRQCY